MSQADAAPIEVVIELLTGFAGGHYDARAVPTGFDEDLDAVIVGVNMLAEELEANRAQLEDRVQQRTAELEAVRSEAIRYAKRLEQQGLELRSAAQAKGDFIAQVSHELRTPLTSIIGYLDLLDDVEEPIPEEALHYLAAVNRNSHRLLLLVTDLLTASEVENAPMRLDLASTNLSALAHQCIDDLSQRANEAGLTLIRDLPPDVVITADATRVMQVIDNLLSNAIKFTPAGGQITVTLLPQGHGADLIVRDTGIGIETASLPHLTTKFFRTPQATAAAIPGVGLGLMITNSIVEAHNGTLSFTSREHEGTSAHVRLPKNPHPRPVTTPSPVTDRHLKSTSGTGRSQ